MDHNFIEEQNIADQYLMGKLSPSNQALFEQHFINCPECIDLLEEIRLVRNALRVADVEANVSKAGSRLRLGAFFSQPRFWRQAAVVGALLLLLISVPAFLLLNKISRLQQELDDVKSAYTTSPPQSETPVTQDSNGAEQRASKQALEQQGTKNASTKTGKQLARAAMPEEARLLMQPHTNVPIFIFNAVRSSGPPEGANNIIIDRSNRLLVLSLELEEELQYKSYRAIVSTINMKVIWEGSNLRPNQYNALTIGFSSNFFAEADYLLTLQGVGENGSFVPVANYPFHVIKK